MTGIEKAEKLLTVLTLVDKLNEEQRKSIGSEDPNSYFNKFLTETQGALELNDLHPDLATIIYDRYKLWTDGEAAVIEIDSIIDKFASEIQADKLAKAQRSVEQAKQKALDAAKRKEELKEARRLADEKKKQEEENARLEAEQRKREQEADEQAKKELQAENKFKQLVNLINGDIAAFKERYKTVNELNSYTDEEILHLIRYENKIPPQLPPPVKATPDPLSKETINRLMMEGMISPKDAMMLTTLSDNDGRVDMSNPMVMMSLMGGKIDPLLLMTMGGKKIDPVMLMMMQKPQSTKL